MIPLPWVAAAALALGAVCGYWLAVNVGELETARAEARRMQCEQQRAEEARAAHEKAAALLARAEDAEAQSARQLAAARAAADRKLKETRREIYRLATGRECLSGPLRLRLNAALAADDVPKSAADVDPAHSAPADDSAIAQWIADAIGRYDECRARIDAIREWDEVTHGR